MYLRNWSEIQGWMQDNGIIRWNVSKNGNSQENNNIFLYDDDKTLEENKAICERVLDRCAGDYVVIVGWRTDKGRTGGFSAQICYDRAAPTAPAAPAVSGFAGVGSSLEIETLKKDIYREIKNEFDGQRLERERKEFEDAKRDFEAKQNGVIGLLVEYLAPVAQQLAGKLRPMPRVAGLDAEAPVTAEPIHARQPEEEMPSAKAYQQAEEEEVFTDEESDRLFALMARFKKVEPDYLQLIESVVTMAEAGDSTYTMAKSFLIKK